jgi:DNA-directed RNA polymerase specialized sigma24 family protein
VLVNAARSELRRRRVARRWSPPGPGVVGLVEHHDDLLAALGRLTPRRRIAVVLRFCDDRSEREVAEIMGCAVGTVKSLVSRALADLRAAVTEP